MLLGAACCRGKGEGCSTRADSALASVGEVALAVQALKPDVVLLEICSGRKQMLDFQDLTVATMSDI